MWYVVGKNLFKAFIAVTVIVTVSSCGQPSGNAPGGSPTPSPSPITSPDTAVMKYGEIATTSGGWTVSIDNSDPVENSSLANGWTVEVLGD